MAVRADERLVGIAAEAAYADGGSWGTHKTARTLGRPDISSIKLEELADGRVAPGGGSHRPLAGLAHNVSRPTFSAYPEGLITAPADGSTAAKTFVTHCIEACHQSEADLTDADIIAGTPSATALEDTDSGAHAVSQSTIGLTLVVMNDGTLEWFPYTYSAPNLAGLMALSAVPNAGNLMSAAAIVPYVHNWSGAIGISKAMRFVNQDGGANTDILASGMFGSYSIPSVGPRAVPQMDFSWMMAGFTKGTDLSVDAPSEGSGSVMAGATVRIAKYGETAWTEYCVDNAAFDLNAQYEFTPCIKQSNLLGVSGAQRTAGVPNLTLQLPVGSAPPTMDSGATRFEDSLFTDDAYHVLVSWNNGGLGRSSAHYLPKCHLASVSARAVSESRVVETLMFEPDVGASTPLVLSAQA